jgi:hypothetical protein
LTEAAIGEGVDWSKWAAGCAAGLDLKTFRTETALVPNDAQLAIHVAARAIVQSPQLRRPQSLLYRRRFITLLVDAEHIWCMTTESRPLAWFDLRGAAKPSVDERERMTIVTVPSVDDVPVVLLAPDVKIEEQGRNLVVAIESPTAGAEVATAAVKLGMSDNCRTLMMADGVHVVCNAGPVTFEAPHHTLVQYDHGFLVDGKVLKDLL